MVFLPFFLSNSFKSAWANSFLKATRRAWPDAKLFRRSRGVVEGDRRRESDRRANAIAANGNPLGRRVLVGHEQAALAEEAVQRLRRGDQREAEYVSSQALRVFAVELAQRHEIDRDSALNGAARDHAAVGAGCRHMNEPALRERTLRPALCLLLVFIRKDFQSRVIERRIVLGRSMQLVHVPRANDRLNQPGQLGLRVTRIPHAENKRGRRKLRQRRRVAGVEKQLERLLRFVLQLGRANYGVAETMTSFQYRGDLLVPVSNVDLRNERQLMDFSRFHCHPCQRS